MDSSSATTLLRQCIAPPGAVSDAALQSTAATFTEWSALSALAGRHRILPLVCRRLTALPAPAVPDKVRDHLQHLYFTHAARQTRLQTTLLAVLEGCARAGIQVLPMRGPILGAQLYDDPACRQSDDLDLMVARKDLVRCRNLVETDGFAPTSAAPSPAERQLLWAGGAWVLQKPGDTFQIDLVWSLTPRYFSRPLTLEQLWPSTRLMDLSGHQVPILDATTLLLTLCIHGAKHMWSRHAWTADVVALLTRESVDWNALLAQAHARGVRRMVLAGLAWAARLTAIPLPPVVLDQLAADPEIRRWCDAIETAFDANSGWVPDDNRERAQLQCGIQDGVFGRLRYLMLRGLLPSSNDWRALDLPPALYPLYFLTRPLRLAARALNPRQRSQQKVGPT